LGPLRISVITIIFFGGWRRRQMTSDPPSSPSTAVVLRRQLSSTFVAAVPQRVDIITDWDSDSARIFGPTSQDMHENRVGGCARRERRAGARGPSRSCAQRRRPFLIPRWSTDPFPYKYPHARTHARTHTHTHTSAAAL